MDVFVQTVSGKSIRSAGVTDVSVLWLNSYDATQFTIEEFRNDFVLNKSQLVGITFKGNHTIFIGGDEIDYITISNS
ncbi:hypothetical protein D0501_05635 [Leuconostoc holzapfelii]|uniref:Uncharacterized protein n=1 Tax=Leuconostoc holzapfelii TaxID=434464 RepID=A0ABT2NWL1_9LACO|nr:hypothetical protein [Leuconostoc holzapfelii]MCT8389553.1 hypothetical protein [Leuconostoc holzapfelii]